MDISQNGVMLIKAFEGFRRTAYKDSGGVWTIGWGQTGYINGKKIQEGLLIICEEAEDFLRMQFLARGGKLDAKAKNYGVTLTQNQYDVFLSRMYNFGVNHSLHDELLSLLKNKAPESEIKKSILKGTKDKDGNELRGLVIRRNAEYILWSTGKNSQDTIDRYNAKIKTCGGISPVDLTEISEIDFMNLVVVAIVTYLVLTGLSKI